MNREILDRLWEKDEPLLFVSKEQYEKNLEGWDFVTCGESYVALVKGARFHFQSFGTGERLPLKIVRAFFQGIIDKYGYVETRTPHEFEKQHKFNKFIGFVEVGRDEFDVIYRMEKFGCRS